MPDLKDALDTLYELSKLRDRAKELREQGRLALKEIEHGGAVSDGQKLSKRWIRSNNNVEAALLVKVLNHRDMSEDENKNDTSEAPSSLKKRLKELKLEDLFPPDNESQGGDEYIGDRVPVLVAARAMQALVTRSETVLSKATFLCYYRIVRDLYMAARPDWTIGAARAGKGGNTSAFITGECIRAIFAFEDAIRNTATFFKQTRRLLGRYDLLNLMFGVLGVEPLSASEAAEVNAGKEDSASVDDKKRPMNEWADSAIERMWFDWYISTNPRHGSMALHLGENENQLLFHPTEPVDMRLAGDYLAGLKEKLRQAIKAAKKAITEAKREIEIYRRQKQANFIHFEIKKDEQLLRKPKYRMKRAEFEKKLHDYDLTLSAHQFAYELIQKAESEVKSAARFLEEKKGIQEVLDEFSKRCEKIAYDVHRVLKPTEKYIRTVLNREVATSGFGPFDAGELVFAAASFGAITKWKSSELLTRACTLLVENLPESGRLPTTRPFHSTRRGYRMIPIGCEMTRSFAQLLQNTPYDFEPKLVRRMLNIFDDKLISLSNPSDKKKLVAWNFEGSPDPDKPCVWVSAVSVLAIDRVVRMLNERINSIIFKYFEVIRPEKPHSSLTLNDLIYPDLGLNKYHHSQLSMALRLEQMRAHAMRVTLPTMYKDEKGEKERLYSAIFYGPPGTGKTTLVEALALSSDLPLIRLSPSDLVVQGPAEIEGRARTVFEALSMLTQVVIILDEFEDVVGWRGETDAQKKEDKIFEFLRTAMLPKLAKLHDSARKQSFVYCLATNYLSKIDPAAKRKGRFDLHLPVYDPDPLSRAGTLLYRLWRVIQRLNKDDDFSPERKGIPRRYIEVVEMTSHTHASRLAEDYYRMPKWVYEHTLSRPENYQEEIPFFWYVITGKENKEYNRKKVLLKEERDRVQEEFNKIGELMDAEKKERTWLLDSENLVKKMLEESAEHSAQEILSCLSGTVLSLVPPPILPQEILSCLSGTEKQAIAAKPE